MTFFGEVVTEVGSGLNGKRPKLRRILCARLYGRRGAHNRAMRAVTAAKQAEPVGVVAGG